MRNILLKIFLILFTLAGNLSLLFAQDKRVEMSESAKTQTTQKTNKNLKSGKFEYNTEPVDTNFTFEK